VRRNVYCSQWVAPAALPEQTEGRLNGPLPKHLKATGPFPAVMNNLGGTYEAETEFCLPPAFKLVSCSAYCFDPKVEAICSSKTSVDTKRTTGRYIPKDGTLHNHRCENLKSYILYSYWCSGFVCQSTGICCGFCVFLFFHVAYPCVDGVMPAWIRMLKTICANSKVP
jgi:hypothetical protein